MTLKKAIRDYIQRLAIIIAALTVPIIANARPADCIFLANGRLIMDGPCDFQPEVLINTNEPKGSFRISTKLYFATVQLTEPKIANGNWNEEPGATHAHTPLGQLSRIGACWQNQTAAICVWKLGERP